MKKSEVNSKHLVLEYSPKYIIGKILSEPKLVLLWCLLCVLLIWYDSIPGNSMWDVWWTSGTETCFLK